ncbi:YqcI/YcgG family protein [Candidatus Gottesmanbacteria bacterium]|nr:YqcI/YcgG family protein [Candidatus Gottesmanbacteria bacterium]
MKELLTISDWHDDQQYNAIGELGYYLELTKLVKKSENPYAGTYSGYGVLDHRTGAVFNSVHGPNTELYAFHQAIGKSLFKLLSETNFEGKQIYPCTGGLKAFANNAVTVCAYPFIVGSSREESLLLAKGLAHDLWQHRKAHPFMVTNPQFYAFVAAFMHPYQKEVDKAPGAKNFELLQTTLELMSNLHVVDKLAWDPHCGNDPYQHPEEFRFSLNGEGWFLAAFSQGAEQKARRLPGMAQFPSGVAVLIDEGSRFEVLRLMHPVGKPTHSAMHHMMETIRHRHVAYGAPLPPLLTEFGAQAELNVNGQAIVYSELLDILEGPQDTLDHEFAIIQDFAGNFPFGPSNHETLLLSESRRRGVG